MAAQFSWASSADVGTGIAGAISAWGTTSANRIVAKANADAANVVRKAQNQERASALTLAGAMRAQSFHASLTNAAETDTSATETIARTQQAWTRGNFDMGIHGMEQLGAYAARAAASGTGGASVQAVSYSVRLQQARLAERQDDRQGETMYELIKARSGIMPAAVSRLDMSPLAAGLDYSTNSAPPVNSGMGLIGALTEGLLSKSKSLQVALDSIPRDNGGPPPATVKPYVPWEANYPVSSNPSINID